MSSFNLILQDILDTSNMIFKRLYPLLKTETMAVKKSNLDQAASRASSALIEALPLVEKFISNSSKQDQSEIANKVSERLLQMIRSTEMYSKLMWFAIEVHH